MYIPKTYPPGLERTGGWSRMFCGRLPDVPGEPGSLPRAHLEKVGKDYYLPVFYFTELMGFAVEHPEAEGWLARHLVTPGRCCEIEDCCDGYGA